MIGPDILAQDADDAPGVEALVAVIRQQLSTGERAHFEEDLAAWERRYAEAMQQLTASSEWQEIEQWRAYILSNGTVSPERSLRSAITATVWRSGSRK